MLRIPAPPHFSTCMAWSTDATTGKDFFCLNDCDQECRRCGWDKDEHDKRLNDDQRVKITVMHRNDAGEIYAATENCEAILVPNKNFKRNFHEAFR